MLYTTYGYFLIAKNVYNIKSFIASHSNAFQTIFTLKNSNEDFSIAFEYDDEHRVLIPFTIFGKTADERDKNYSFIYTTLQKFFPSCKKIIKINLKDDEEENTFFNDNIYDCLNDQRSFFNEK